VRRRWWRIAIPALTVGAAALLLAIFVGRLVDPGARREDLTRVKGVGEVVLGVVRERGGAIREDVHTFLPGDRWKVVVTCPPQAVAWVVVDVAGDHPLAPARIACGNRVVVPGAFELTGDAPNRICVRVTAGVSARPAADAPPGSGDSGAACVTVSAER
nr:hypothetical protein [Myxococcota bacterium]